ncbi:GCN5 family acetyltransferase [Aequorivita aquimaris]|uniref:GCN5 family acetyltransferase n=1 Tax=Aequorivita aquimaris TaxID=1548749 RepID=A0A137RHF2_9FLAO|nr:GNAT family N-acetyltransferase [Aequorivita aquimaris]KXN98913.1 GCN5 family acetyltransferase [Aequorivita aquimaris]
MEFNFRKIEKKDKDKVLELFKEAAEKINKMNIDHWQYWKNPPKEKIEWVEEGILNNEFFFIKELNGKNIGMVRILDEDLLYWGKQKEKAKYVHSLVIKEDYNGKGLGTKILQKIETTAKTDNCKYLRLDADSKNPKLCQYYEKIGFEKMGIKELPLSNYNLYEKKI